MAIILPLALAASILTDCQWDGLSSARCPSVRRFSPCDGKLPASSVAMVRAARRFFPRDGESAASSAAVVRAARRFLVRGGESPVSSVAVAWGPFFDRGTMTTTAAILVRIGCRWARSSPPPSPRALQRSFTSPTSAGKNSKMSEVRTYLSPRGSFLRDNSRPTASSPLPITSVVVVAIAQ